MVPAIRSRLSAVRIGREVLFYSFFLAIAAALTWPMVRQLSTIVSDTGDPLLNAWIVDWDCYAMTHRGASIFQANVFYPGKYPLAYSENMLGVAIVMLPSYLAGASALTTYNLAMLLGFAFSGYGAFVLGRKATSSAFAGVVAGVLYAFVPFRFDHLSHVQIAWGGWLPLIFAALLHYRERPSVARAALLCGALVMNGATNVHWLLFGFFAYGASLALLALAERRDRTFWMRLGMATFAAVVVLYPILRPYRVVSQLYRMKRNPDEVMELSANVMDWLVAGDRSAVYGSLPASKFSHSERHLFPGLVAILLTIAALLLPLPREQSMPAEGRNRGSPPRALLHTLDALAVLMVVFAYIGAVTDRFGLHLPGGHIIWLTTASKPTMYLVLIAIIRLSVRIPSRFARFPEERLGDRIRDSRLPLPLWIALLCIVIGVLGSFGLNGFFHTFLFEKVSIFRSVRAVARWAAIAYLGLSLAAAYGVVAIAAMVRPRARSLVHLALVLLALNDVRTAIVWDYAIPTIPPVTQWIRDTALPGPLLELPIDAESAQYYYMLWATTHHKLVMNGTSGFEPPVFLKLHDLSKEPSLPDEFTDVLIRNQCAIVVLHGELLAEQTPKYFDWIHRELQSGRLVFLRRFDHGADGDWVFAMPRNAASWQSLRAPEVPDGAGFTPSQNLARLLDGKATYNNITFGRLDVHGPEKGTPFRIAGWALSPYSIRDVIAHFDPGNVTMRLTRAPRGDVTGRWPWYPDAAPGFFANFDHRPHGVRQAGRLQIEIVDGRGERTRLPTVWVDW